MRCDHDIKGFRCDVVLRRKFASTESGEWSCVVHAIQEEFLSDVDGCDRLVTVRKPSFKGQSMNAIPAPPEWIESVSQLRLPERTDRRMQVLMDRNNDGELSANERDELESLVEMSESLSLVRAEALRLLGRRPA